MTSCKRRVSASLIIQNHALKKHKTRKRQKNYTPSWWKGRKRKEEEEKKGKKKERERKREKLHPKWKEKK